MVLVVQGMHGQAAGQLSVKSPQVLGISGRQDINRTSPVLFPVFIPSAAPAPAPNLAGSMLAFQTMFAAGAQTCWGQ